MKKFKGFTLIEMVVVLAVIAILAAILTPTIAKNIRYSKVARTTHECQVIAAAIGDFYKDMGRWPVYQNDNSTTFYYELLYSQEGVWPTANNSNWNGTGVAVDSFDNHLILNKPGGSTANAYRTEDLAGVKLKAGYWRGPYLDEIREDQWGQRYEANIKYVTLANYATVVLSAGEDRNVSTNFLLPVGSEVSEDDLAQKIR
ncbi:MAG: type II secretion system protein [Acidobacteriota bacterium]